MAEPIPLEVLLREQDWLCSLARRLVSAASADDVVQQTFVAALTRPPRDIAPPRSWLSRVARHFALRERRAETRRRAFEHAAARPEAQQPLADTLDRIDLHRRISACVLELAEPYRSTVLWHFYECLSTAAIAERAGTSEANVRKRLQRGIEHLRARLDRTRSGWRGLLVGLLHATDMKGRFALAAAALLLGIVVATNIGLPATGESAAVTAASGAPVVAGAASPIDLLRDPVPLAQDTMPASRPRAAAPASAAELRDALGSTRSIEVTLVARIIGECDGVLELDAFPQARLRIEGAELPAWVQELRAALDAPCADLEDPSKRPKRFRMNLAFELEDGRAVAVQASGSAQEPHVMYRTALGSFAGKADFEQALRWAGARVDCNMRFARGIAIRVDELAAMDPGTRHLHLQCGDLGAPELARGLERFASLRSLCLEHHLLPVTAPHGATVDAIRARESLEALSIRATRLDATDLERLAELPRLSTLELWRAVPEACADGLLALAPRLRVLRFLESEPLPPAVLHRLAELTGLEELRLSNGACETLPAATLQALPRLSRLDLTGCSWLDDKQVDGLLPLRLRRLVARSSWLTTIGIRKLQRMPSLRELDIRGLKFADELVALAGMTQLERLWIHDTVAGGGAAKGSDAIARLRAALPKCEIVVSPGYGRALGQEAAFMSQIFLWPVP